MAFVVIQVTLALALTMSVTAGLFNCTNFDVPPLPKNISQLHPGHVSIVMAMGDSITAAFAIRSTLMEGRDISWSIGVGSEDQLTFPWLVSQYNELVEGMSTKAVLPHDIPHLPHNDYHPKTDHLNVAESEGAVRRGSMEEQWGFILQQIPNYPNFKSSWKVLTIWMMANDVCGKCDRPVSPEYLESWASKYDELLVNVSSTMTNVYVNLVSTLDLSNVARIQRSKLGCKIEHQILRECGCIDKGNSTQLKQLDENVHIMNNRSHQIAAEWYKKLHDMGRNDMAVVQQSFQEGIGSTLDIEFLNKLDCFHPSTQGHQSLAVGLWDSMLCTKDRHERCGLHFFKDMSPTCPTKDSVFYTGPDVIPGPPPCRT